VVQQLSHIYVALAFIGGIVGNIIKITGTKVKIYEDSDEFAEG